jgi:hypothetical protein
VRHRACLDTYRVHVEYIVERESKWKSERVETREKQPQSFVEKHCLLQLHQEVYDQKQARCNDEMVRTGGNTGLPEQHIIVTSIRNNDDSTVNGTNRQTDEACRFSTCSHRFAVRAYSWLACDRDVRLTISFSFDFKLRDEFPFPEGDGSGPSSTALQCRDDPWHRSE